LCFSVSFALHDGETCCRLVHHNFYSNDEREKFYCHIFLVVVVTFYILWYSSATIQTCLTFHEYFDVDLGIEISFKKFIVNRYFFCGRRLSLVMTTAIRFFWGSEIKYFNIFCWIRCRRQLTRTKLDKFQFVCVFKLFDSSHFSLFW
jgi:hypothetical protein